MTTAMTRGVRRVGELETWQRIAMLSLAILSVILWGDRAQAGTRIRGEFEYDIDDRRLSEWKLGPIFPLGPLELEIPVGQTDQEWVIEPELKYEVEVGKAAIEFSVGAEIPLQRESPQPFGKVEAQYDF